MIRINDIQTSLFSLVGWRQDYNPNKQIDASLTDSTSGLYYQDAHPLITLTNIRAIMPDDFNSKYPIWVTGILYASGSTVNHNNTIYISIQDNASQEPSSSSQYWKIYDSVSDYLKIITNRGIATVIERFLTEKSLKNESKQLLEHATFFNSSGRKEGRLAPKGQIVGFEFQPLQAMGVTMQIERIGVQFIGATGMVKMYIFHSSSNEPIKTIELMIDNNKGTFKWVDVADVYLHYAKNENAGGTYYLCYDQNDLPLGMESINFGRDWSRPPCGTCNQGNVLTWSTFTRFLKLEPFGYYHNGSLESNPELWDTENNFLTACDNHGLNVQFSIYCDLSDFIISQKGLFQSALQKTVAMSILRDFAYNPNVRVNREQLNASRAELIYEIDGDSQGYKKSGLGYELENIYKALKIDTQGISRECITCNNNGVEFKAI